MLQEDLLYKILVNFEVAEDYTRKKNTAHSELHFSTSCFQNIWHLLMDHNLSHFYSSYSELFHKLPPPFFPTNLCQLKIRFITDSNNNENQFREFGTLNHPDS